MVRGVCRSSKNSIRKKDFYSLVFSRLKVSTNLSKIQEELNLSKQQLNYYLRGLLRNGLIQKKGMGWYEVAVFSKNSIQYDKNLAQDLTRGHAYIWKAKISKISENWKNRIGILKENKINYKLVGAMNNIPRIKVMGRKVWLCNNFIKIWETKGKSFYGDNATDSGSKAYDEIMIVINAIENKLGLNLRPYMIDIRREHYALIKNDLAIHHNRNGEVLRVSDKDGEWLLIDDSLGEGGELENIGIKSKDTHNQMKEWWNDLKYNNFDITATDTKIMFKKMSERITSLEKQISIPKADSLISPGYIN